MFLFLSLIFFSWEVCGGDCFSEELITPTISAITRLDENLSGYSEQRRKIEILVSNWPRHVELTFDQECLFVRHGLTLPSGYTPSASYQELVGDKRKVLERHSNNEGFDGFNLNDCRAVMAFYKHHQIWSMWFDYALLYSRYRVASAMSNQDWLSVFDILRRIALCPFNTPYRARACEDAIDLGEILLNESELGSDQVGYFSDNVQILKERLGEVCPVGHFDYLAGKFTSLRPADWYPLGEAPFT